MKKLLIRWAILSVAFWLVSLLLGDHFVVKGDWLTFIGVAFIFGLVNATIGNFTRVMTFPFTIVTLGLWLWGINALMLLVTDHFSDAFDVSGFGWALVASFFISVISSIINRVSKGAKKN